MSIATKFLGMNLLTPFFIASGQHTGEGTEIGKWAKVIAENYWGGIITKTYLRDCDLIMRPYLWSTRQYRRIGMQNSGPNLTNWDETQKKALYESVRSAHDNGIVVVGSIMAGSLDEWREISEQVEGAGVDGLELNLSCPAASDVLENKAMGGYHVGQNAEVSAKVTEAVSTFTSVPVLVKLTPNTTDPVLIAKACMHAGAKGVSAINTVQGIIGIDIESGIPISSDVFGNSYKSGISGPIVKPVGLRVVADIAKECPGTPISGIGGISDWKSAVEYIMVGASTIQVCTAVMWFGFGLGRKLYAGLTEFMDRKGYNRIDDFKGIALEHLTTKTVAGSGSVAVINQEKCDGCMVCYTACQEAAFSAMSVIGKSVHVSKDKCDGCGLCKVVCTREAIDIVAPNRAICG